ncbi:MAG: hypothetical protein ACEQSA_04060 [Weeksellaceae bacterium]
MNKRTIIISIVLLVIMNVGIFMHGISLGDDVNKYEQEISRLKKSNMELEQQMYSLESITQTASLAAELKYDRFHDPLYIDQPQYALK